MSDFDDMPVGAKSNKNQFEEFEKLIEIEQDEKSMPLEQRVKSRNFATRKEAFEEIFSEIKLAKDKNDPVFMKYYEFYSVMLNDAHFLGQEVGLNVIENVFINYDKAFEFSSEIIKIIIEKCYSSSKTNIKEKALISLTYGVEICNDLKGICEAIKSLLEKKNPKVQSSALQVITYLISNFGSFKVDYRPLLSLVEKLTESSTPAIRNDALEVYKELYKWVREAIKPSLAKLKEVYQKDLEKAFDEIAKNMPKIPDPKKYLKNDKPKLGSGNGDPTDIKKKMDMLKQQEEDYNLAESIDVFSNFTEDWCEEILKKEKKWVEKKEMLEKFIKKTNVFKIKNTSHSNILSTFIKLLKDSNINVVNYTILAINSICIGLRKDFIESKEFFPLLIEKFKDKNKKLVTDAFQCLENFLQYSLNLEDAIDQLRSALTNDKATVQSKEKICVLIEKIILKTYITQLRKLSKNIGEMLFKITDDPSSEVRDAALHCLGVLKFRIGDVAISKKLKKKKIEEAANENIVVDPIYNKEENKKVSYKMELDFPSNHNSHITSSKTPSVKFDPPAISQDINMGINQNYEENLQSNKINTNKSTSVVKTTLQTKTKACPGKTQNNSSQGPKQQMDIDEEDSSTITNEEVEEIIKLKLGNSFVENMNNTKWDVRRDAFIELSKWILDNVNEAKTNLDIILKYQKIKLKDYKENNFNIIKEALNVLDSLISNCDNFSKKHAAPIVRKIHEKIGDNKVKEKLISVFFKMMDYLTPKYILNILLKQMNSTKPVNVLKEFALILDKSIEEYGINLLPIKEIVEFAKLLASHANPQLRIAATNLFCLIYKYIGPSIKKFMNDIKEATLRIIEAEFEKTEVVNSNNSKRELKGEALNELKQTGEQSNNLDSLFPRMDISKKITPKMLKDFNEGNWQIKKETLEAIDKIIVNEANMRILPNGLNELVNSLKNKLNDGNKNLVRILIQFLTKFFEALGVQSNAFVKILIKAIVILLGDKQNLLREDVVKCLDKLGEIIGYDRVFLNFPGFLIMENFDMRNDILKFMLKNKIAFAKCDCKEFIPAIVACLQDKSLIIKGLTEDFVKEITRFVHHSQFANHLRDLKPAIAADIKKILEKNASDQMIIDTKKGPETNNTSHTPEFKVPNNNSNTNLNQKNIKDKKLIGIGKKDSLSNEKAKPNKNVPKQQMHNIKVIKPDTPTTSSIPEIIQLQQLQNQKPDTTSNNNVIILQNIKHKQKEKRLESERHFQIIEFYNDTYRNHISGLLSNYIFPKYLELATIKDLNKNNTFLLSLQNAMRNETIGFIEIVDIIIKWLFIKTVENNNTFFWDNILLEFILKMAQFFIEIDYNLHEIESKLLFNMVAAKLFSSNPNVKSNTKTIFNILAKITNFECYFEFLFEKVSKIDDKLQQNELLDILKYIIKNMKIKSYQETCKILMSSLISLNDDKQKILISEIIGELIRQNEEVCLVIKDAPTNLVNYLKSNLVQGELQVLAKYEVSNINMIIDDNSKINEKINTENEKFQNKLINLQSDIKQIPNIQRDHKSIFSKSPILSNIKQMPRTNHIETPLAIKPNFNQDNIDHILANLKTINFSERNLIFVDLLNLVKNKFEEYSILLINNINKLFICLIDYLSLIFDNLNVEQYFDSLKYLLPILLCLAQQKELAEKLEINNLLHIYERILNLMLYKDLEKVKENEKIGKIVLKSLNELLFNLMENCKSSDSYQILIKIVETNRKKSEKVCDLSIKCILKLNKVLPQIIEEVEISKVFSAIYNFLTSFREDFSSLEEAIKSKCDDMCLRIMKSIVNEIFKIKKDKIWMEGYNHCEEKLKETNSKKQDIRNWIVRFMRTLNGQSLPSNSCIVSKPDVDEEMNIMIKKVKEEKECKNYVLELLSLIKKRKLDVDFLKNKFTDEEFVNINNTWKALNENNDTILKNSNKNDNSININAKSDANKPLQNISNQPNSMQLIANVKNLTEDPSSRLNHYRTILYNLNREKSVNKDNKSTNQSTNEVNTQIVENNQTDSKTFSIIEKFQKLKEISKKENTNDLSEKKIQDRSITNIPTKGNNDDYMNKLNEWKQRLDQFNGIKK